MKLIEQLAKKIVIIFDLDDTILLSFENFYESLIMTCQELSFVEISKDDLKKVWGFSLDVIITTLAEKYKLPEEPFEKVFRQKLSERTVPIVDGAIKVLKELKSLGFTLVLLSNRSQHEVNPLYDWGLDNGVFALKIFRDTNYPEIIKKPDPRILNPVIKSFENIIGAKHMVFVGDSVTCDWPVAKHYGIDFLAVLTGIHNADDFTKAGVPRENIITSIASIFEG